MIDIEFDPNKDTSNLLKHGISLSRAREFELVKLLEDTRKNYGETRYRAWGFIDGAPHALAFSVTELRTGGKRVRAISLREATPKEIAAYDLTKNPRRR
jgi:uncharacterized protein